MKVGIVGAGLAGRLTALNALTRGWDIHLFDKDTSLGHDSCGWVAAGMLAPFTELESSELLLCELGLDALDLWPQILEQLEDKVAFARNGTLIVAHPQDKNELDHLITRVEYQLASSDLPPLASISVRIAQSALNEFVPGISTDLQEGLWISGEGHVNSQEFYKASTATLMKKVTWHENTFVEQVSPHHVRTVNKSYNFDLVFDCRGLGAIEDWSDLRGIRGEVICLHTPEVSFNCPVRVVHPRYPIYISPRAHQVFFVGATAIESADKSPISAQSMLELLSACYTLHPGFAQARIIQTMTQCRPTLSDHNPRILAQKGLIRINGLFRHGYMVGPVVVNEAILYIEQGKQAMKYPDLIDEVEE